MDKPFIDFYTQIGFAPTGQQEGQVQKHRENRSNLYRKLGLHPGVFNGASVLEIGPGSGENSIDLLGRGIRSLKLLDGVPVILESLKSRILTKIPVFYELGDVSITPLSVDAETFEIVICEGVIPLQLDPIIFFNNVANRVAPGGILVITATDEISGLSEILRRIIAKSILSQTDSTIEKLEEFFRKDFELLGGMTRTASNWILDSIMNPWVGKMFSIEDALKASPKDFRPISMSPNLHLDQAWYKNTNNNSIEKEAWINSYKENCHQLIDFRTSSQISAPSAQNSLLLHLCNEIFLIMQDMASQSSSSANNSLSKLVQRLVTECPQLDSFTNGSLMSFRNFIETGEAALLKDFRPFWGRGQQYLCFERSLTVPI